MGWWAEAGQTLCCSDRTRALGRSHPHAPPWLMDLSLLMPTRSRAAQILFAETPTRVNVSVGPWVPPASTILLSDALLRHLPGDQPLPSALSRHAVEDTFWF